MDFAVLTVHDEPSLLIHVPGHPGAAVIGHPASQVHAPRLVPRPVRGKPLHLVGVERPVKPEIRHILGQPFGVFGKIHLYPLQRKARAVGQTRRVKITLLLGQIDPDARQHAVPVGGALAQDAHHLFAVQQKVVGPLDLTLYAVALFQGIRHRQTGKERQGTGLRQRRFQHHRVVEAPARRVGPLAAQPSPARRLVGGVHRPDGPEPVQVRFGPGVGAVHFWQIQNTLIQKAGTRFHPKEHFPSVISMTP